MQRIDYTQQQLFYGEYSILWKVIHINVNRMIDRVKHIRGYQ